ncbi:hypothetical protein [Phaeobacter italicus]|uniref:hypothetical protein n=1 Tax=Phaeobacter italicus TaxID=481446 RepID=UPI00232B62DF|nr:hypothetical protein [Phaeobacter italicus]
MKKLLAIAPVAALAGCMGSGEPMVSDYNGRIVKVQFHDVALGANYKQSPIYAKAVETCKLDGRSNANYQGVKALGNYQGEHVFLCV